MFSLVSRNNSHKISLNEEALERIKFFMSIKVNANNLHKILHKTFHISMYEIRVICLCIHRLNKNAKYRLYVSEFVLETR